MCPRIGQSSYIVIFRTDCIDMLYIANSVGLDNRGGSPVRPSTEQLQNPQQTTVVRSGLEASGQLSSEPKIYNDQYWFHC